MLYDIYNLNDTYVSFDYTIHTIYRLKEFYISISIYKLKHNGNLIKLGNVYVSFMDLIAQINLKSML